MKDPSPASSPTSPEQATEVPLDSWKEIASYVKRDVSTVQRWEKREGMPIHRHLHDKRGSVYAFPSELDAWLNSRKPDQDEKEAESAQTISIPGKPQAPRRLWFVIGAAALLALSTAGYVAFRMHMAAAPPIRALAVLPFKNLSGDPSQEYLADGMTEALVGRLSAIRDLRVISRTSVMHFKDSNLSVPEIAKALGVDAVVEGSVIHEGNRIRVHVQLIRAATDAHIWAEEYDREYSSVLSLEEDVASSVAERTASTIKPRNLSGPTPAHNIDPEAHEAYLKGRYYFNQRTKDALNKSLAFYQQAIARDPNFALAYSGLADAYAILGFRGDIASRDALLRAKAAALKAIELDATLAEPHASLGFIAETHEWDWATAEREYKRALQLNPGDARTHHWYAGYLTYVGRFEEGVAEAKRARDLDPLSLPVNNALAGRLLVAGRIDEALKQVQQTLDLDPHFAPAHQTLGWAYLNQQKPSEAIQEFRRALQLSGTDDTDLLLDLGFAYAKAGHGLEARNILAKLKNGHEQGLVPAGSIGILYGALGEPDLAFDWLNKAYEERDPELTYAKVPSRRFEPLRRDPRFQQLIKRLGLPE
jgi:TolB-like protein/Flp pilus assembly protein TadD